VTYTQIRVDAAVKVAAGLGIQCGDPVVLADGANVVVHLSPAPVVAKVAESTTEVRPAATWLQRELDVVSYLAGRGAPVMTPSPEVPATVHHGDGQVMSFWRYLPPGPRPSYSPWSLVATRPRYSLRAASGPVTRLSSGNVAAMIPSVSSTPPATYP
jgi:hypothetical protein